MATITLKTHPVRIDGIKPCNQSPGPMEREEKTVSPDKMKALNKVAETTLERGITYRDEREFGPVVLELLSNDYGVYRLWQHNWPAPSPTDRPRRKASVRVAVGVRRHEPGAYHCAQSGDVTLLNISEYARCHDWALGLAAGRMKDHGWMGLQAATVVREGSGTLIAGADPALTAATALGCALYTGAELQNLSWTWLTNGAKTDGDPTKGTAHRSETAFFVPPSEGIYDDRIEAILAEAREQSASLVLAQRRGGRVGESAPTDAPGLNTEPAPRPARAKLAAIGAGASSACRVNSAPVAVENVVLVERARSGDAEAVEQSDPDRALERLAKGIGEQRSPWASPQLFQPHDRAYRRLLGPCLRNARVLSVTVSRRGMDRTAHRLARRGV
ncbi:MAG: hypothetical protein ACOC7T_01445 [Planctomycetota bacterium]